MKINKIFRVILILTCLLLGTDMAYAKYTNLSTSVSQDGVTAKLYDRRNEVGDTYGYVTITNSNKFSVTVNWVVYRVEDDGSRKCVYNFSKLFSGKSSFKQTYDYGDDVFKSSPKWRTGKYYVAIEVVDGTEGYNNTDDSDLKFTKPGKSVSTSGVSAKLTDRRKEIGAHHNTYGYITFKNSNDCEVKVTYKVYGMLGTKGKLVHSESIVLNPKEERGQTFSYGVLTDMPVYDGYTMTMAVEKQKTTAEKAYNDIIEKDKKGEMTQSDYTMTLNLIQTYFNHLKKPMKAAIKAYEKGNTSALDDFEAKYKKYIDRVNNLTDIMDRAYAKGKLNDSNKKKMNNLKKKIATEFGMG